MECKSTTCNIGATYLAATEMFGVVGFLFLLTAVVEGPDDVKQISANIGERVVLSCRREVECLADKISWFKNGDICFQPCFKEDYDLVLNKSYAALVIPSVKQTDAGRYQYGSPSSCLINLTVSNMSAADSEPNTLNAVYYLLRDVTDYVLFIRDFTVFNSIFLIFIFIIAAVIFFILKWWNGKYKKRRTNAECLDCEVPLRNDELKTLLHNELTPMADAIKTASCALERIAEMVKPNDDMKNELHQIALVLRNRLDDMSAGISKENKRQAEEFEDYKQREIANIMKLKEDFNTFSNVTVLALRQLGKDLKELKGREQSVNEVSVSDIEPCIDGASEEESLA